MRPIDGAASPVDPISGAVGVLGIDLTDHRDRPGHDASGIQIHDDVAVLSIAIDQSFPELPLARIVRLATCVDDIANLGPWCLAKLADGLPAGTYRLNGCEPGLAALGWLLGQHRFTRYKSTDPAPRGARVLLSADAADIDPMVRLAQATALVRDLVDTPAADLGPAELEAAARDLAKQFGAKVEVTSGDALAQGYPMIAAVGQGATRERAPRLIELRWGKDGSPRVAIVGKGVCFDSGGLDIKPASGMRLMKKDMGGAAHALALARLVMAERLPVRLHLLIPAVENAIAGNAYRPGEVITTRNGLTVEIDNTDAEGRLILCDALAYAAEQKPDLILDFARGQDRLQITFSAEGHPATGEGGGEAVVRFQDLDTDGSGVLDGGDAAVSIQSVSHDGAARASLVIDAAKLPYQSLVATHGTITLFGVTALGAADIDATTPMSAFHLPA